MSYATHGLIRLRLKNLLSLADAGFNSGKSYALSESCLFHLDCCILTFKSWLGIRSLLHTCLATHFVDSKNSI